MRATGKGCRFEFLTPTPFGRAPRIEIAIRFRLVTQLLEQLQTLHRGLRGPRSALWPPGSSPPPRASMWARGLGRDRLCDDRGDEPGPDLRAELAGAVPQGIALTADGVSGGDASPGPPSHWV